MRIWLYPFHHKPDKRNNAAGCRLVIGVRHSVFTCAALIGKSDWGARAPRALATPKAFASRELLENGPDWARTSDPALIKRML